MSAVPPRSHGATNALRALFAPPARRRTPDDVAWLHAHPVLPLEPLAGEVALRVQYRLRRPRGARGEGDDTDRSSRALRPEPEVPTRKARGGEPRRRGMTAGPARAPCGFARQRRSGWGRWPRSGAEGLWHAAARGRTPRDQPEAKAGEHGEHPL